MNDKNPGTRGFRVLKELRKCVIKCYRNADISVRNKYNEYYELHSQIYGNDYLEYISDRYDEVMKYAMQMKYLIYINGISRCCMVIIKYTNGIIVSREKVDVKRGYLDVTGLGVTQYINGDLLAYKVIECGYNWAKIRKQDIELCSDSEYDIVTQNYRYSDSEDNETKVIVYSDINVKWSYTPVKAMHSKDLSEEKDSVYVIGYMCEFYSKTYKEMDDVIKEYR